MALSGGALQQRVVVLPPGEFSREKERKNPSGGRLAQELANACCMQEAISQSSDKGLVNPDSETSAGASKAREVDRDLSPEVLRIPAVSPPRSTLAVRDSGLSSCSDHREEKTMEGR
jgi:hypothetical protein